MAKRAGEVIPDHLRFGYQHNQERARIREHLIRRGHDPRGFAFELEVTRIQDRIHKYKPSFADRQKVWLAKQPKAESLDFTEDELRFLLEHFRGANDPTAKAILDKAGKRIKSV